MNSRNLITRVPDDRLAKLPVYAQDEINMARRYIAELEAELEALVNTDHAVTTYADPHAERPKPIGDNPTVRHRFADGDEVTVDFRPEGLKIMGTSASYWSAPVVLPELSNVLWVKMVDSRVLPGGRS